MILRRVHAVDTNRKDRPGDRHCRRIDDVERARTKKDFEDGRVGIVAHQPIGERSGTLVERPGAGDSFVGPPTTASVLEGDHRAAPAHDERHGPTARNRT